MTIQCAEDPVVDPDLDPDLCCWIRTRTRTFVARSGLGPGPLLPDPDSDPDLCCRIRTRTRTFVAGSGLGIVIPDTRNNIIIYLVFCYIKISDF